MRKFSAVVVSAIFIFGAISFPSGPAEAAQCRPFPKFKLWANYTHDNVKRMVATRMGGDWEAYLARIDARLKSVKAIQAAGKALILTYKSNRYRLAGKNLEKYVRASEMRRDVVQCLADESVAEGLENFATAAGPAEPPATETSAVRTADLKLDVEGRCDDGSATFKVTNLGDAWPKTGAIGIYRLGAGKPLKVNARRMRFAAGQFASFKIKATRNTTGQLGLFVDPSWTARPFTFDATLTCR